MTWWYYAAMAAASVLGTLSGKDQVEAQNQVLAAQRDADKMINDANNEMAAAKGNFHRVAQSLNTRRLLKGAEDQVNASASNITRMLDDFTRGGLARQLQASEELGALSAQAAATGTGGTTQEMIGRTAALKSAVAEQAIQTAQGLAKYDAHMQKASIISSAIEGIDVSPVLTNLNYVLPNRADIAEPNILQGLVGTFGGNPGMFANATSKNDDVKAYQFSEDDKRAWNYAASDTSRKYGFMSQSGGSGGDQTGGGFSWGSNYKI